MFKPGDRVRYLGNPTSLLRNCYEGQVAVVIDGKGHYGPLKPGYINIRFEGGDYRLDAHPYNSHTLEAAHFELVAPLSPFEAEIQAYINSELHP